MVAWEADELPFHNQLTSHPHVNPSQTEVSLREGNKWSRSEVATGFNQLYLDQEKKVPHAADSDNKFCSLDL